MKQTCPRRIEDIGPWERDEGLDEWKDRDGQLTCSFCGSLHPDTFMDKIRAGAVLGPTDKTYKAYLSEPVSFEQATERKQRWMESEKVKVIRSILESEGLESREVDERVEQDWVEQELPMLHGPHIGKFYYQHLSEDQRREFVDLLNQQRVTIGYPGHLYVLPFFCVRKESA